MFKVIRTARFNELNQQLDGLRSVNDEKTERINVLEGYVKSLEMERETLRDANTNFRETVKTLERKVSDYKEAQGKYKERIESFRIGAKSSEDRAAADKARIDELETELKVVKGKSNTLSEQSLKDKETIQNLKNDIEKCKENIAWKENKITDLRGKLEILREKAPVPTPPTTSPEDVPNTLKDVELGAVAPLEAEVVPTPKPNIVGNVKRPYRKSGKFKRK